MAFHSFSHFSHRKVESDAAGDSLAILEIAKETHSYIEAGHNGHGGVQNSITAL